MANKKENAIILLRKCLALKAKRAVSEGTKPITEVSVNRETTETCASCVYSLRFTEEANSIAGFHFLERPPPVPPQSHIGCKTLARAALPTPRL